MGLKFIASIGECDCRWYLLQGTNWDHAVPQSEIGISSSVDKNATIGILPATVDNNATRATPSNDQANAVLSMGGKKHIQAFIFVFFWKFSWEATFRKVLRLVGLCPNSFWPPTRSVKSQCVNIGWCSPILTLVYFSSNTHCFQS